NGAYNIFLMKTDGLGNSIWSRVYYGPSTPSYGRTVYETVDSGFVICGNINGSDAGILKTDSLGNIQWTKTYSGWSQYLKCYGAPTFDGGYVLAGCPEINGG